MTITTSALNNIESAITNPSVNGIFIVNYDLSTGFLSHSFAQIETQIQAGNLILIKFEDNDYLSYDIVTYLINDNETSYFYISTYYNNDFYANSSTDLLSTRRQDNFETY